MINNNNQFDLNVYNIIISLFKITFHDAPCTAFDGILYYK
jgi:hypothetical protein